MAAAEEPNWRCYYCGMLDGHDDHHPECEYAESNPPDQADSDAIKLMSDGVVLELADGTTARLRLHNARQGPTAQPLIANRVSPNTGVAQYGEGVDDRHVNVWFERE